MKNVLIISTDLNRPKDPSVSLSIASLLCYLKSYDSYRKDFIVEHFSINMAQNFVTAEETIENLYQEYNINDFDFIFISCYVWSEYLVKDLLVLLRKRNYKNIIGLGGYQITYSSNPGKEYPECEIFISGYGEQALLKAITEKNKYPKVFRELIEIEKLPSPYLEGEIKLKHKQSMVRMETLRGCPFRCSFCAHRDLSFNKVYFYPINRIFSELALFKKFDVEKVNILDPIFNLKERSNNILKEIKKLKLNSLFSLQTRFENIKGKIGEEFIELCSELNVHLEFGIQSIHSEEYKAVNRPNKLNHIQDVVRRLNDNNISYEISLIYGLPNQTLDSFQRSIDYFCQRNCNNIKAYPLMLLKGTELYSQKEIYNFHEEVVGKNQIPVVVSSNTFNKQDWIMMNSIANELMSNGRYL